MPDSPDPTAPYRDFLTAIRDALTVPFASLADIGDEERLRARRAGAVAGVVGWALTDGEPDGITRAAEYLRGRTAELPVLYRRYMPVAQDNPADCLVCGPGCCAPVLGVHASCPGPLVGRTVVSTR